jgi:hypothetical protein
VIDSRQDPDHGGHDIVPSGPPTQPPSPAASNAGPGRCASRPGGIGPIDKVLLTGRLTRDPELRVLASGKNVTTFSVASNEYVGGGKEQAEFHFVVTWD